MKDRWLRRRRSVWLAVVKRWRGAEPPSPLELSLLLEATKRGGSTVCVDVRARSARSAHLRVKGNMCVRKVESTMARSRVCVGDCGAAPRPVDLRSERIVSLRSERIVSARTRH